MPPELVLNQRSWASLTLLRPCGSLRLNMSQELCWHAEPRHAAPHLSRAAVCHLLILEQDFVERLHKQCCTDLSGTTTLERCLDCDRVQEECLGVGDDTREKMRK
jgi:hypothetical protein